MKSSKDIVFALSIFASCGCAHLATVKAMQPRVPMIASAKTKRNQWMSLMILFFADLLERRRR